MKIKAVALSLLVVLSTSALWAGGTVATHPNTSDDLRPTVLDPKHPVNNSSDGVEYRKGEPSQESLDKPIDFDTAPDRFTTTDRERAGTASILADTDSSIIMDPSDDATDPDGIGTTKQYLGSDNDSYYFKNFTLLSVGDNVEVWVARDMTWPENDSRTDPTVSEQQAEALRTAFDENIYDTEADVFGKPDARNGTDSQLEEIGAVPDDYYHTENGSGKTVLLVDNIRDENYYNSSYPIYTAGFYSPQVQQYTDRNVVTLDAAGWQEVNETNDEVGSEGTLAHEYQHLIHNDLDSDETTWVNEGMSDYAETVTGYGIAEEHVHAYEELPSNSLTNWEDQGAINVLSDYGIALSFQMYLSDRYGTDFISNLAHDEKNGIAGVEETLNETGANTDFYHLYQDFSTAAVLDSSDHHVRDEYDIDGLDLNLNTSNDVGTAGAWGTNYKEVDTSDKGPITGVELSGTDYIGTQWQTATDPVDGEGTVLYSGSGTLLDRYAIMDADLSNGSTLSFETNYDIEKNWDYGFVQVSTDGGETWESLESNRTDDSPNPDAHPTVKENVPGYTGTTNGTWVNQSFDLSKYESEGDVLVAFRYVTDWATTHPGMYVRNVEVGGEHVATDSTDSFESLREATGDKVEYQFTFIGIKKNGRAKVKQLDMRTFDDGEKQELEHFLHNGNFEKVIAASTWAAHPGEGGRVPVSVEFEYARDGHGHHGGHGHGGHHGGHGHHGHGGHHGHHGGYGGHGGNHGGHGHYGR
ncbi:immune inhibitor A [Haladaptatus sp. AB618]|uniref:immune inhibitor A domain-containing protein n=1 Tax=Haladaptatus sp. AB618 TaxID=2934173 RepID=UPI00209C0BEB|nr:immune inhibitor A domain-containing protein [Haladaptatus sp. AB618]MCO8254412.1 immune inhibitor A [Haladaptatus sp. AB618]